MFFKFCKRFEFSLQENVPTHLFSNQKKSFEIFCLTFLKNVYSNLCTDCIPVVYRTHIEYVPCINHSSNEYRP